MMLACFVSLASACYKPSPQHLQFYSGACDASAAVAISSNLFAMANDEDSVIRVYDRSQGGPALHTFNLAGPLELDTKSPETDIEGAAAMGDRVYWITSHARNQQGKERPSRCRFFATQFEIGTNGVSLRLVGRPYKKLIQDLAGAPELKQFNFGAASRLAPKDRGGLNIEGLAVSAGNHLLIAFRNPVPGGRALIIPLQNPDALIAGERAKFGDPILLDLGGLGIRDIAWAGEKYLIAAGPYSGGKGRSRLYVWDGRTPGAELFRNVDLSRLNPEALVLTSFQSSFEALILSDDSSVRVAGITRCCDLKDDSAKKFRAIAIRLD